jgi:hypothetical protein
MNFTASAFCVCACLHLCAGDDQRKKVLRAIEK